MGKTEFSSTAEQRPNCLIGKKSAVNQRFHISRKTIKLDGTTFRGSNYRIYSFIRREYTWLPKLMQICKPLLCNSTSMEREFLFLNNPKDLDPSYKTDLDH